MCLGICLTRPQRPKEGQGPFREGAARRNLICNSAGAALAANVRTPAFLLLFSREKRRTTPSAVLPKRSGSLPGVRNGQARSLQTLGSFVHPISKLHASGAGGACPAPTGRQASPCIPGVHNSQARSLQRPSHSCIHQTNHILSTASCNARRYSPVTFPLRAS